MSEGDQRKRYKKWVEPNASESSFMPDKTSRRFKADNELSAGESSTSDTEMSDIDTIQSALNEDEQLLEAAAASSWVKEEENSDEERPSSRGSDPILLDPFEDLDQDLDSSFSSETSTSIGSVSGSPTQSSSSILSDPDLDNHEPLKPPYGKLQHKLREEYFLQIDDKVTASRGEALLNVLRFSKQYSLPHDAHASILKLINSLFFVKILPDSRYLLDELYVSNTGTLYHFYCSSCFSLLKKVDVKAKNLNITCANCLSVYKIQDMVDKCQFFVTLNIPLQLEILFKDKDMFQKLKSPRDLLSNEGNILRDLYDGIMYRNFALSLDYSANINYLSMSMCTDGSPLFKSSSGSVWPLFLMINEFPPLVRMEKLLLAGFWFGSTKPNFNLFFEPFVKTVDSLSNQGCTINNNNEILHFKIFVIAVCVDSGARGSIQGIHQHNGEHGCNWCLHPGITLGDGSNARKYLYLDEQPQLRDREEVLRDGAEVINIPIGAVKPHVNGVVNVSQLVKLRKFDIVLGMINDYLHSQCFGVARQITKLWFGTDTIDKWISAAHPNGVNPPYYIGSPNNLQEVNKRMRSLCPPVEVRRLPREISDLVHFKAREWENWILFFSIPVLDGILRSDYLNHWLLYVQAMHILLKKEILLSDVDVAETLLHKFVKDTEKLYKNGDSDLKPEKPCKQMTFNFHITLHLPQNVRNWGPAWSISSYAFEDGNGKIKKIIRANKGIDSQIVRHISQDFAIDILKNSVSSPQSDAFANELSKKFVSRCTYVGKCVLLGKRQQMSATAEQQFLLQAAHFQSDDFVECVKIIYERCCYTTCGYGKSARRNNSVVYLNDGSFAVIRKIIANENTSDVYFFISQVHVSDYGEPILRNVTKKSIFSVVLTEESSKLISISDVYAICVQVSVSPQKTFVMPMPNIYNIF